MAQDKDFDSAVDVVDRTKWLWAAIIAAFVLMIAGLYFWGQTSPNTSQVRVRHILVSCDFNDPVSYADALDLVQTLRKRIVEDGDDFGQLARNYSNDPSSSFRGGELPPAERGVYEAAFDEYAWNADIGEVSPPIQTAYGFHLIEVLDRRFSEGDLAEQRIRERAMDEMRRQQGQPQE